MKPENAIIVRNLNKSYHLYNKRSDRVKEAFHPFRKKYHTPFSALSDVSLSIQKGETIGIIGRNGSGKSTLLQVICGILNPTSGTVEKDGRISALLELGAGFNPEFTGRENVYINGAIFGLKREEIDARFNDIESFADIGIYIDQPVKSYSSGMYVRLAFAVAVNARPDILIVDEALAVGDTLFQSKCFAKFKEFQKKGVTILFVSHSMDLVTRYCRRAYLLEKGKLLFEGSSKHVVDEYNRLIVNNSIQASFENGTHENKADTDSFREWRGLFKKNPHENRYGNGQAEIIEAGIFTEEGEAAQTLVHGKIYDFKLKARFNGEAENPIFAYTIKDIKGFDISGTNTLYQNISVGTVKTGDILMATFRHKVLLNAGGYLLSFGCAGLIDGEYVVFERRYDVMAFDIISERSSVGFVDMDSDIQIDRLN